MDEVVNSLVKELFLKNIYFWVLGIIGLSGLLYIILNKIIRYKSGLNIGEYYVDKQLKGLPEDSYKVLDNLLLEINNNTHQIDHVVISKWGIFVVETKCYDGLITGKEKDFYWYQHLGKKKYKFKNPIHQNYGHIKAISDALKMDEDNLFSIVCFTNQSTLNISTNSVVIQRQDLVDKIIGLSNVDKNIDVENVYNQLLSLNITDEEKRNQHIMIVKSKQFATDYKIYKGICPKCGGQLVTRNGKYGTFVGCSNYPKCKFTQK